METPILENDEFGEYSQVYEEEMPKKKFIDAGTSTDDDIKKEDLNVSVIDLHGCKYFGQFIGNELLRFDIKETYERIEKNISLLKK